MRSAQGQYPAELAGRIRDAISGDPVENVRVEVLGSGLSGLSDGRGEFRIRGLESGRHRVHFVRLGYEPLLREVELRSGDVTRLAITLGARPLLLDEVRASAEAGATRAIRIDRQEIEASGAATAAELLEGRTGLVVQRHGPAGPQTLSIRGSSADAVLVLLDGAPLANPLTGEADLSSIPSAQIESVAVLKGGQSARFGPGAEAGVVLLSSRRHAAPLALRLQTGSLGTWSGAAETRGRLAAFDLSFGGQARTLDGDFRFERPRALGGGSAWRTNSDLDEASLFAAASAPLAAGRLQLRSGVSGLERGLPGPSYSPTPAARERMTRWHATASWERPVGRALLVGRVHGLSQRMRIHDPSPPAGPPYDSRSEALAVGGRLEATLSAGGAFESFGAGLELKHQAYASTALDRAAPDGRFDLGLFLSGVLAGTRSAGSPRLLAALRADHDGLSDVLRASHELTLSWGIGPVSFNARHASSYSPPSFGDQFFKAGVAVEPNPELRAERVPSDISLGVGVERQFGDEVIGWLDLDAYLADVKDMIIWAPDYRFVWSPRNFDVKRRGLDAEIGIELTGARLDVRATYSLARATYDRPGDDDAIQVMYRPRHTGGLAAAWRPRRWEIALQARYMGTRYPVPAPLNALEPFWTVDLRVRHRLTAGPWQATPTLVVERLLDNENSLIFGYPEPGRTVSLQVVLQRHQ